MTTNAILATETLEGMSTQRSHPEAVVSQAAPDSRWVAVLSRDAKRDGEFVFAVSSTGVYCRPSCAARRPRRENVEFFSHPEEAEHAGYRACLRCRPKAFRGNTESDGVKAMCRFIEQHLDEPLTLERLAKEFHQSPFHLQRRFKAAVGITPKAYARLLRFQEATALLMQPETVGSLADVAMSAGYYDQSHLTRDFAALAGMTPGTYAADADVVPEVRFVQDADDLVPA